MPRSPRIWGRGRTILPVQDLPGTPIKASQSDGGPVEQSAEPGSRLVLISQIQLEKHPHSCNRQTHVYTPVSRVYNQSCNLGHGPTSNPTSA